MVSFEWLVTRKMKNKANWGPARPGQWLVVSEPWFVDLKMQNKANLAPSGPWSVTRGQWLETYKQSQLAQVRADLGSDSWLVARG